LYEHFSKLSQIILYTDDGTASLLIYLLAGLIFSTPFVLIFIITTLLLAADFYYTKNIAGRRLVGLRWWNEVNPQTGDSHWVFESAPQPNEPGGKLVNATDKRFFWLALYAQPALWVALAVVALVTWKFIWLTLVGEYLLLGLEGKVKGEADLWCSDCDDAHDYEYACILTLRQVQPGEWNHGYWFLLGITGTKRRRRAGIALLQQMKIVACRVFWLWTLYSQN